MSKVKKSIGDILTLIRNPKAAQAHMPPPQSIMSFETYTLFSWSAPQIRKFITTIPSIAFFVMLNLFTWLKSKVNTHSFKIRLEETTSCSEVYGQGLILGIQLSYIIFYFVNLGNIGFFNLGFWFANLAILFLLVNKILHLTKFLNGFLCDLGNAYTMDKFCVLSQRSGRSFHCSGCLGLEVMRSLKTSRSGVVLTNDPQNGLNITAVNLIPLK